MNQESDIKAWIEKLIQDGDIKRTKTEGVFEMLNDSILKEFGTMIKSFEIQTRKITFHSNKTFKILKKYLPTGQ